jgi:capsular polysaccharide biosynthesis protein/Mrp family chromosome partitioning ATPase
MATRQPQDYDDYNAEPRSIDLREYWLIVRRRWLLVLVLTVLGAVLGAGYAVIAGPVYSATSQVVVTAVTQGPLNTSTQVDLQVNMSTEQAVAQSPPVIEQAARLLNQAPATLQAAASRRLTVSVPATSVTTSNVLQITWQAGSPRAAQAGANAFANAYLSYRHRELAGQVASLQSILTKEVASLQKQIAHLTSELSNGSSGSSSHQGLEIRLNELTGQASTADSQLTSLPTYNVSGGSVIGAARPSTPSGIGHSVIVLVGALLGLLIGLVLAFVRDAFDDRVRDADQLERNLGAPTLAVLPPAESGRDSSDDSHVDVQRRAPAIATAARPDSRAAEAVRALRATLVAIAARRNLRTILVVGADTSVSSGRIAAELGVALAESGRRVLLVAADMRGSSLPQIFDLPNNTGLSDLLVGGGDPEVLTRQPKQAAGAILPGAISKRLAVLPSGPQMAHALAILDSGAMLGLLQSQREAYEFVVLDSPPASIAADVYALASHVDGVIVLAREARSRGRSLADLRRRLDQVGAVSIGGVFIGKGRSGHHRHRSSGSQQAISPSVAAVERPAAAPQPARRPAAPVSQPAAPVNRPAAPVTRPAAPVSRPAAPVTRPPAPVTRPMPAVPGDESPRATGYLAKRQL